MYGGGYNQQQGYGQQPSYGAPAAGQYGQPPANQYGAPPAGQYGAPQGQYGAPQGQYGAPQGQYGAPQGQYGAPQGQYGAPQSQYGAPQGQYGAQQGQYGAQQGQYGAQGGQYGAPATGAYGAPAAGAAYGAPAAGAAYGAPPAQQHSAYPGQPQYNQQSYGQQQQYGQPAGQYGAPAGQYGAPAGGYQTQTAFQATTEPRFLGVQIPAPPPAPPITNLPNYNPQFDADRIRKAAKGFGTDEDAIIDTMAPLDAFQMELLTRTYEQMVGRSLVKTLEKELRSWLEYVLVLLSRGPLMGDVHLIERACKGMGTHEDLLSEVLLCRSNYEMHLMKEAYRRAFNKDMVKMVQGELSMKTERMFNMAMAGTRDENPVVNHQLVQQDVESLYRAGAGKVGTDEIGICSILLQRSDAHLQAVAQAFPQRHRITLSKMIESEFSGHMRDGLLYVARTYENDGQGVHRDAFYLEEAMKGMGTKDERLCYRLVRVHWNRPRFNAVKQQYNNMYRKSLASRVKGETSGKYENALVAIINQN